MIERRKAAVFYGISDIRMEEIPAPCVCDDDVLIRIKAVGVCGSDVHYYKEGRIGPYEPKPGHILGHEAAGEVVSVGKNVKNRKIGDRVAIEPGYSCRKCEYCKSGKYNLCKDMMFMSHPDPIQEGCMTEYVAWPADFTHLLPDNVTYEEGAMAEPLSVALQALKRGGVKPGQSIAIFGCGTIGLCIMLAAEAFGCSEIYMIDKTEYRLSKAANLGAKKVVNIKEGDYVNTIKNETGGAGVDVVLEASGSPEAYLKSTALVKRGGTVVLVGSSAEKVFPVCIFEIIDKELNISSVFRYNNVYGQAIKLLSSGLVDMKKIITHRMPLKDAGIAMDMVFEQRDGIIKAVLSI